MGKSRREHFVQLKAALSASFCKVSRLELTSPTAKPVHLYGNADHCSCGALSKGQRGLGRVSNNAAVSEVTQLLSSRQALSWPGSAGLESFVAGTTGTPSATPVQGLLSIVLASRYLLPAPLSSHRGFSSQTLQLLPSSSFQSLFRHFSSSSVSTQLRGERRLSSPSRYSSLPSAGLRLYYYSLLSRNVHASVTNQVILWGFFQAETLSMSVQMFPPLHILTTINIPCTLKIKTHES